MDNTVRDSVGNIMSVVYGGDGYNARYLETVKLPVVLMSDAEIQRKYGFDGDTFQRVLSMRTVLQNMRLNGMHTIDAKFRLPVNITRLLRMEEEAFSMFAPADMFASWEEVLAFEATLENDFPMRLQLLCAFAKRESIPSSIFGLIRDRMEVAKVSPGEAVGPIASTSIGEPTTQVSLAFLVFFCCFSTMTNLFFF